MDFKHCTVRALPRDKGRVFVGCAGETDDQAAIRLAKAAEHWGYRLTGRACYIETTHVHYAECEIPEGQS